MEQSYNSLADFDGDITMRYRMIKQAIEQKNPKNIKTWLELQCDSAKHEK